MGRRLPLAPDALAPPEAAATLRLHEIYTSVQGESTWVGVPCTFVRLSRCNLRCRWCDTPQAFSGGEVRDVGSLLATLADTARSVVEITGGEPMLQPAVLPLMRALCDAGFTVLLETSGERDIAPVDPRVHRIMDLKAPGSGESDKNRWENLAHLGARDDVKVVLADRADYEWARDVIRREALAEKVRAVLFSAVHGELDPATLVEWILEDALPVRFQLQLHKVVWGAEAEGV